MKKQGAGVIIMAGGSAERMGYPKLFLKINQATFIEAITAAYRSAGIENIVLVLNEKYHTDEWKPFLNPLLPMIKIILNSHPELGRMHSVMLGRSLAGMWDYTYLQNCDNPWVQPAWLEELWNHRISDGYVVPLYSGRGGHPVLLSKSVLSHLPDDASLTLKQSLAPFPHVTVDTGDERLLWNVNTPEDYERYVG